eukprot:GSChrysophyteH1.ASY1.ANO1.3129.1 assembled CDS
MTTLLIIDPQNDFHAGGSLAVPGADEDAVRLADWITRNTAKIDSIVITLDTHHKLHIAHAAFWQGGDDPTLRPNQFDVIRADDVVNGKWLPRDASLREYCVQYLRALETSSKFLLCIWPEHCLQGSVGHAVVKPVFDAVNDWVNFHADKSRSIQWVNKGQNCLTEMYSALAAEVPVPSDPTTHMNEQLRQQLLPLSKESKLVVAGQAKSHCVACTMRDILGDESDPEISSRVIMLEDCMSAVTGFENEANSFERDMKELGVQVIKSSVFVPM